MQQDPTRQNISAKVDGDQYQIMDTTQDKLVDVNLEKYKRTQFQNFEAKTKVMIELTELQKEMANDQTNNIDEFNKKFKSTTEVVQKTEKEVEKYKENVKTDWTKVVCYIGVVLCIFVVLLSLKSLGG